MEMIPKISPGVCQFEAGVSLVSRFVPGRFTSCLRSDLASFFSTGDNRVVSIGALRLSDLAGNHTFSKSSNKISLYNNRAFSPKQPT